MSHNLQREKKYQIISQNTTSMRMRLLNSLKIKMEKMNTSKNKEFYMSRSMNKNKIKIKHMKMKHLMIHSTSKKLLKKRTRMFRRIMRKKIKKKWKKYNKGVQLCSSHRRALQINQLFHPTRSIYILHTVVIVWSVSPNLSKVSRSKNKKNTWMIMT